MPETVPESEGSAEICRDRSPAACAQLPIRAAAAPRCDRPLPLASRFCKILRKVGTCICPRDLSTPPAGSPSLGCPFSVFLSTRASDVAHLRFSFFLHIRGCAWPPWRYSRDLDMCSASGAVTSRASPRAESNRAQQRAERRRGRHGGGGEVDEARAPPDEKQDGAHPPQLARVRLPTHSSGATFRVSVPPPSSRVSAADRAAAGAASSDWTACVRSVRCGKANPLRTPEVVGQGAGRLSRLHV